MPRLKPVVTETLSDSSTMLSLPCQRRRDRSSMDSRTLRPEERVKKSSNRMEEEEEASP